MRFADSRFFSENYVSTIGCDFKMRSLEVGGVFIKVESPLRLTFVVPTN